MIGNCGEAWFTVHKEKKNDDDDDVIAVVAPFLLLDKIHAR